ncbi:single-stranded DNA-binding protein [Streptomyces sp. NPDC001728]|uniref:single-stranded DNA-binding protein n=1 Tax=Streptomyces sp. NPDC001728 TaxID=3154396 RepID=UPI0033303908
MNETTVTLVGNVATAVEYRDTATGGVARFRFAVPTRRWDRVQALWSDGPTSFYTVSAWRSLGANLAASVSVGEPLVVHGRLRVREDERDGQRKTFVDVAALAVGHDLSRGTAAFRRAPKPEQRPEPDPWAVPVVTAVPATATEGAEGAWGSEGTPATPATPATQRAGAPAADAVAGSKARLVTVP